MFKPGQIVLCRESAKGATNDAEIKKGKCYKVRRVAEDPWSTGAERVRIWLEQDDNDWCGWFTCRFVLVSGTTFQDRVLDYCQKELS